MQQQIDKKFLYKQNRQLRLQLKQAHQLIQVHKEAVYRLSQPYITHQQIIPILLDLLSFAREHNDSDKLKLRISELEGQQMVLEKIVEQTDNDQKQTYHLLAEEYNKIKQDNEKLENQLHRFYQKIGEVDYISGLVTKYKQIILPSEQAIAFKKEQEQLLQFISMQKQTIRKLKQEKSKLLKINIHMKQSVQKHKDQVKNMTIILNSPQMLMNLSNFNQNQLDGINTIVQQNILDELNDEQNGNGNNSANVSVFNSSNVNVNNQIMNMSMNKGLNTTMNFIKMQRKIIKQQNQDEVQNSDEQSQQQMQCQQLNILFPDKVQKIKKDRKITKVPYLNMMKIRELMAKKDGKIRKQIQAENRHINPTDKIIKLETELEITRKQLTNQTLKFRNMSQQFKNSIKFNQQLLQRNNLLIAANQRLSKNYSNMYKDYQFTKIIALRVQKALSGKLQQLHVKDDLNKTQDFQQKINKAEIILKKVFGKSVTPL